ncbi:MAG: bifunctional folylpolyglutamate synthase/dihydrofolate synthase, partial [Rhizobiales bacterium]|nr:bifunctional folylpolyglutamate synthase/dihydrofolate synthase [Hyphomicrobiales bacterium]
MDRSSAILERLLHLHPREIDLSLDRVEALMGDLGRPQDKVPPVIHVAGTNGKGSTTAFMRAMLEAAGKRVHVYTSPHLVRFHERIRLAAPGGGTFVDEDELADALIEVERINAGRPITQFEIPPAAAFVLFADHPADVLLMEVGLGGRLDATNVVAHPLATVITSISMDHEKFLGDTIAAIAAEKAGILKRGAPAIVAPQVEAALAVIESEAAARRADLFLAN